MPEGPGKYDDVCTIARLLTGAHSAIVIVLGGNQGHGFSSQMRDKDAAAKIPDMLEDMARQIRETVKEMKD